MRNLQNMTAPNIATSNEPDKPTNNVDQACPETGYRCYWIYCCEICNDYYCQDCYRFPEFELAQYPVENPKYE